MKTVQRVDYRRNPSFDRKGQGVEIQEYGLASDKTVVCCGVHWVPALTARYLWKLCSNWRRWRRWYDRLPENRKRNYPAKTVPAVVIWAAHPITEPTKSVWIAV